MYYRLPAAFHGNKNILEYTDLFSSTVSGLICILLDNDNGFNGPESYFVHMYINARRNTREKCFFSFFYFNAAHEKMAAGFTILYTV
jgi:hypothetical protein